VTCPEGEVCVDGRCYAEDCPSRSCPGQGEICVEEECLQSSCVGVECPEGERCASGQCYPADCETKDCQGYGEVCVQDECVERSCVGVDCPSDERCAGGRCYPADCEEVGCGGEGEVCVDGVCQPAGCVAVACRQGYACRDGWCYPESAPASRCQAGSRIEYGCELACEAGECNYAERSFACPRGSSCEQHGPLAVCVPDGAVVVRVHADRPIGLDVEGVWERMNIFQVNDALPSNPMFPSDALHSEVILGLATGGKAELCSPLQIEGSDHRGGCRDYARFETAFFDDFSDYPPAELADRWIESDGNPHPASVEGGELAIRHGPFIALQPLAAPYRVQARMRTAVAGADPLNAGWLMFHRQDSDHFYLAGLDADGMLRLGGVIDGTLVDDLAVVPTELDFSADTRYEVLVHDGMIRLSASGQVGGETRFWALAHRPAQALSSGEVKAGFWAFGSAENPIEARVAEVELADYLGGCEIYHEDANGVPYYDLDPSECLFAALDHVLALGLRPVLHIGQTPTELSAQPRTESVFGVNTGTPKDYARYYDYIRSLFDYLLTAYAAHDVEDWVYRLSFEPDNPHAWNAGFEKYRELYDHTMAAMRDAGIADPILYPGNLAYPLEEMLPDGGLAGSLWDAEHTRDLKDWIPWTEELARFLSSTEQRVTLFSDSFSDGTWTDDWGSYMFIDPDLSTVTPQGKFRIVLGDPQTHPRGVVYAGDLGWTDYRYSVRMKTVSPGDESWEVGWVTFHAQGFDGQDAQLFAAGLHDNANGTLQVARKKDGQWEDLPAWVFTGLDPKEEHLFEVMCHAYDEDSYGQTITISIDGVTYFRYRWTAQPDDLVSGKVGAMAWNSTVEIDDAVVKTLDATHAPSVPRHRGRFHFSLYEGVQLQTRDPRKLRDFAAGIRGLIGPFMPDAALSIDEYGLLPDVDPARKAAWHAAVFAIANEAPVRLERLGRWYEAPGTPTLRTIQACAEMGGAQILERELSDGHPYAPERYPYLDALAAGDPDGGVHLLVFHYEDRDPGAPAGIGCLVEVQGLEACRDYELLGARPTQAWMGSDQLTSDPHGGLVISVLDDRAAGAIELDTNQVVYLKLTPR
ncbi:MAG: hypothetical protein JXR96_02910, partial [Deltaproteobacteria bacterium]|nr:hypothetical protein [Deltaproteobacteria bacterium]